MVKKTPLMGWSSWNAYMVDISDSIICKQADLLVETGLRDKGYRQVNIDDGFFGYRNEEGQMTVHPERFPQGMKAVVDHIHSLDMKAGIYSDAGHNTCGSIYNNDPTGVGAGLLDHEIQDADLYFNKWGFDFIKIDYCGGSQDKLSESQRYSEIRRIVDSVANKNISINACRWAYPGTWVSKVADSWRTTSDIRPKWNSIKHIIDCSLYLSAFATDGHYNDMDMLVIGYEGNGSGLPYSFYDYLTEDEEDTHFGIWCILDSPLLIGCKLEGLPQHSLDLLGNEELIAVNQDPLGLQAHVVQHIGETYVFVKDLLLREGPLRAVALYNPSDIPVKMTVSAEELGYKGTFKVRDLIAHMNLGKTQLLSFEVPAHGVKMLKTDGKRQEQTRYEAEWAYLPAFCMTGPGPCAVPCESASGRAVVKGLGGEGGSIVWPDVFSFKGGDYQIEIVKEGNVDELSITVCVNEKVIENKAGIYKTFLQKGYNTISISSPSAMPDIDCILVSPSRKDIH